MKQGGILSGFSNIFYFCDNLPAKWFRQVRPEKNILNDKRS
jgi:hypothetical protein